MPDRLRETGAYTACERQGGGFSTLQAIEPKAQQPILNTAKMPFVFKHVAVMPDCHYGKGATVPQYSRRNPRLSPPSSDLARAFVACSADGIAATLPRLFDKAWRSDCGRGNPSGPHDHSPHRASCGPIRARSLPTDSNGPRSPKISGTVIAIFSATMRVNSLVTSDERSSALTLICLSHLRWHFVLQRPQHLMTRYPPPGESTLWKSR